MTREEFLERNPNALMAVRMMAENEAKKERRCLDTMAAIVKAGKKGERIRLETSQIAELMAYLNNYNTGFAAKQIAEAIANHPGMLHNS